MIGRSRRLEPIAVRGIESHDIDPGFSPLGASGLPRGFREYEVIE
jgi:hypothetical protein